MVKRIATDECTAELLKIAKHTKYIVATEEECNTLKKDENYKESKTAWPRRQQMVTYMGKLKACKQRINIFNAEIDRDFRTHKGDKSWVASVKYERDKIVDKVDKVLKVAEYGVQQSANKERDNWLAYCG